MILADQIAQATGFTFVADRLGDHPVPGAAERAGAVAACTLRFVLEPDVVGACTALRGDGRTLRPHNPFLRLIAPACWIEWVENDGLRTGVLITADSYGRLGVAEVFWQQRDQQPDLAQAAILIDVAPERGQCSAAAYDLALRPGAHALADCLRFRIDPRWLSHLHVDGEETGQRAIESVVANVLPAIETALALCVLLTARDTLQTTAVDRSKLNRSRRRRGRAPLLDHVQIRLNLDAAGPSVGVATRQRRTARLHEVRGHLVVRRGSLFWRRPHLRGTAGPQISRRTVTVHATSRHPH